MRGAFGRRGGPNERQQPCEHGQRTRHTCSLGGEQGLRVHLSRWPPFPISLFPDGACTCTCTCTTMQCIRLPLRAPSWAIVADGARYDSISGAADICGTGTRDEQLCLRGSGLQQGPRERPPRLRGAFIAISRNINATRCCGEHPVADGGNTQLEGLCGTVAARRSDGTSGGGHALPRRDRGASAGRMRLGAGNDLGIRI